MRVEAIAREATKFYKALPMLNTLQGADRIGFMNYLGHDMAKISLLCSNADGTFNQSESLATTLLMHGVGVMTLGGSTEMAITSIKSWNFKNPFEKQIIETSVSSVLNSLTYDHPETLVLPTVAKVIDQQYGYNWFDKVAHALYRFAEIIVKADGTVSDSEKEALRYVRTMIYGEEYHDEPAEGVKEHHHKDKKRPESTPESNEVMEKLERAVQASEETIEEVLEDLNSLIGLENIKEEVQTLINFLKVQKIRMERGMEKTPFSLHAVFSGPPGTGKTTVARMLGRIYGALGFLPDGHLVETDRAGLVAGFIGQTSGKVDEVVNKAMGGVLFIDEAYALQPESSPNDFGYEAINIILKRMEDNRDKLVVVVAGYTEEMANFVDSNPGLKSRFNRYFYFDHYPPDRLLEILEKFCKDANYKVTSKAKAKLLEMFAEKYESRDRTFGNARHARNIFEKVIANQANRIANISPITDSILTTITEEDIT